MKVRFSEIAANIKAKLISGIKRFPEALILSAIAVMLGIYLNHNANSITGDLRNILTRIIMVLCLGIPLSLCIKESFESRRPAGTNFRILLYAAGAASLVLYYLFLLPDFKPVPIARYIGISLALYLVFTLLPHLLRRDGYEMHIIKLLTGFIITYLYSLILYLGLIAIIFTVNKLFNADISSKVYFDIFLIVVGIFALGYFLSVIPKQGEDLSAGSYYKVLRVLLLNIVMPLTLVYSAILYAYFIKILVTWNWPTGLVSNLVLWFTIITAAVIFLIYPLKEEKRQVMLYVRWFPLILLPLLAMMFISIGIRINEYGFTENRYFVVAAGLWVTGCMLYLAIKRNSNNIVLTASLALVAVLSVVGPWSAFTVSVLSQNMRFEKILVQSGMLKDGNIVKPSSVPDEKTKNEITEILQYFGRNHSLKEVNYLPENFNFGNAENLFGFQINQYGRDYYSGTEYFNHTIAENNELNDIKGYDYYLQFPYNKQTKVEAEDGSLNFEYMSGSKEIAISQNGKVIYKGKPEDIAVKLHSRNRGRNLLKASEMRYIEENNDIRVLYLFRNISGTEDTAAGTITANMPEFDMFIKLK